MSAPHKNKSSVCNEEMNCSAITCRLVAKWLRIFGFDTVYPDATTDDDMILQIAKQEKRFLISRDKELLRRGKKAHIDCLEIHTTKFIEQLTQVLASIPVDLKQVLTRCTLCNTPLLSIRIKDIFLKVFEPEINFGIALSATNIIGWDALENMREKIIHLSRRI
jgi:uncharacterized protein with PIN domain